jgi:hypothetical protein
MIGSLLRAPMRIAAVLAVVVLAGVAMTLSNSDPAHAASAGAGARSVTSAATPQNGSGTNGCVYLFLTDDSPTQVFVHAELLPGCDIAFSAGHWQILTPRQHYNTPDGTYQPFSRDFLRAHGNICAIWWYRDAGGTYHSEGEPCVPD